MLVEQVDSQLLYTGGRGATVFGTTLIRGDGAEGQERGGRERPLIHLLAEDQGFRRRGDRLRNAAECVFEGAEAMLRPRHPQWLADRPPELQGDLQYTPSLVVQLHVDERIALGGRGQRILEHLREELERSLPLATQEAQVSDRSDCSRPPPWPDARDERLDPIGDACGCAQIQILLPRGRVHEELCGALRIEPLDPRSLFFDHSAWRWRPSPAHCARPLLYEIGVDERILDRREDAVDQLDCARRIAYPEGGTRSGAEPPAARTLVLGEFGRPLQRACPRDCAAPRFGAIRSGLERARGGLVGRGGGGGQMPGAAVGVGFGGECLGKSTVRLPPLGCGGGVVHGGAKERMSERHIAV